MFPLTYMDSIALIISTLIWAVRGAALAAHNGI